MKKNLRIITDIAMLIILPMLMAYSLIGEKFHEIIGSIIFILFIVHHVINRNWYKALNKGKYSPRRVFQTTLNFLLLIFMILQPISGILMSKHLYTFLPVLSVAAKSREIHLLIGYWGYVLMSIHAGTHLNAPLNRLRQKDTKGWSLAVISGICISAYGIYAFIKRNFAGYMFMKTLFVFLDFSEPLVFFFADYLAVMVLFAVVGHAMTATLSGR